MSDTSKARSEQQQNGKYESEWITCVGGEPRVHIQHQSDIGDTFMVCVSCMWMAIGTIIVVVTVD